MRMRNTFLIVSCLFVACGPSQADGDRACQSAPICHQYGACWYRQGANPTAAEYGTRTEIAATGIYEDECEARSSTDCQKSESCLMSGACSYVRIGRDADQLSDCVPSTDGECASSKLCRALDRCSLLVKDRVPRCATRYEIDQEECPSCKLDGLCRASGGTCRPIGDADCRDSEACKTARRCKVSPDGTKCVAPINDCIESEACITEGRCRLGANNSCEAGSDDDCLKSKACKSERRCVFDLTNRTCVKGFDRIECKSCKLDGKCHQWKDRCVPFSNANCADSQACKKEGLCKLSGIECVKL